MLSSVDGHQSQGVSVLLQSRLPRGGGGGNSELKSPPAAGELVIKKWELYPKHLLLNHLLIPSNK